MKRKKTFIDKFGHFTMAVYDLALRVAPGRHTELHLLPDAKNIWNPSVHFAPLVTKEVAQRLQDFARFTLETLAQFFLVCTCPYFQSSTYSLSTTQKYYFSVCKLYNAFLFISMSFYIGVLLDPLFFSFTEVFLSSFAFTSALPQTHLTMRLGKFKNPLRFMS